MIKLASQNIINNYYYYKIFLSPTQKKKNYGKPPVDYESRAGKRDTCIGVLKIYIAK